MIVVLGQLRATSRDGISTTARVARSTDCSFTVGIARPARAGPTEEPHCPRMPPARSRSTTADNETVRASDYATSRVEGPSGAAQVITSTSHT